MDIEILHIDVHFLDAKARCVTASVFPDGGSIITVSADSNINAGLDVLQAALEMLAGAVETNEAVLGLCQGQVG